MRPWVAVVGLGLIGGSVARRVTEIGGRCVAFDPDPAVRQSARELGLVVVDSVEALSGCDITVLAAPTPAVVAMLGTGTVPPGDGLVIDVCSAKTDVVAGGDAGGLADRFVGAHPMAGKAVGGFDQSEAGLLVGATWVLTPGPGTQPARLGEALRFVSDTFEAGISVVRPEVHDQTVGATSHLPHVLGQALMHRAGEANTGLAARLAAGSFNGATRVVRGSPTFPAQVVWSNRDRVAGILNQVIADLGTVRDSLADGDRDAVSDWFTQVTLDEPAPVAATRWPTDRADVAELLSHGEADHGWASCSGHGR